MQIIKKNNKNYSITDNNIIIIYDVNIPYGIENYKNKYICNIFLNKYNNYHMIYYDKLLEIENNIKKYFIEHGLNYKSPIKENNQYYIVRSHVNKFFKLNNQYKIIINNIWVYNNNYGFKVFLFNL